MRGWRREERGNVAVWFALASLALAGLGGGALTLTRLHGTATRLQDLADGAALAAAVQGQDSRASAADIVDAAQRFGRSATAERSEAFDPAAMRVEIVKRSPAEVTVTLDQDVHTILSGLIGRDRISIRRRATAVAGAERLTCLHVLEPSAPSALHLQGNPDLSAPNCSVQVNSTAPGALHAWGSPSTAAEATWIAGPATPIRVRNWSPAPSFGQPAKPDPLATRIAWPAADAGCMSPPANTSVLRPGNYCDGLELARGDRLQPGVYVIQRGGVEVRNGTVTADGVTLVLLDPAGAFNVGGGASLTLTAPTAGAWAGIALAAKPGPTLTTSTVKGDLQLAGTLYLPGQKLLLQGGHEVGGTAADRALIVRQLVMQGSPRLSLAGGHPSGRHGAVRLSR